MYEKFCKKRNATWENLTFISYTSKYNLTLKNVTYQIKIWHSDCQNVSVYCTGEITADMILSVH